MTFTRRQTLGTLAAGLTGLVTGAPSAGAQTHRPTLFTNGDILTMEGNQPTYVQSLVEQNGRIVFLGSLKEARGRFPHAQLHDLRGQTLLPGFIDGHGHIYLTGITGLMANILPPPDGPAASFETIVRTTRAWMDSPNGKLFIRTFGWVVANGYDDGQLREGAHPTAALLDQISTELPVLAIHQSGHVGCLNSKGLALAGYTADTPDPIGGTIARRPDGTPIGLVEEAAFNKVALPILGKATPQVEQAGLALAQSLYLAGGYTTAQEGRAFPNISAALERAAQNGNLKLDVIAYPDIAANAAALTSDYHRADRAYTGRLRVGGAKLSLDGSPQAKTAWLREPYFIPPHGAADGYRGYPAMSAARAEELATRAFATRAQLLCHANGDAAIDQLTGVIIGARRTNDYPDHRSVLVHGQLLQPDQIARLAENRILPSLFPAHTYYWGDFHRKSVLGAERASRISPCRDVLRAGLTLTIHHDAPVIMPNAMRVLDAAINRTTRTGFVLGPDQRLTPYEGLKGLTEWAAYQCFEESSKGTLAAGKLADLVILNANPLKVPSAIVHRIQVSQVFKEGRLLHS